MNARVKQDYRWNDVIAFGGHEFIKGEWRPVPPGFEAAAMTHDWLEIQVEVLALETESVQDAPKSKRKSGGKL